MGYGCGKPSSWLMFQASQLVDLYLDLTLDLELQYGSYASCVPLTMTLSSCCHNEVF